MTKLFLHLQTQNSQNTLPGLLAGKSILFARINFVWPAELWITRSQPRSRSIADRYQAYHITYRDTTYSTIRNQPWGPYGLNAKLLEIITAAGNPEII